MHSCQESEGINLNFTPSHRVDGLVKKLVISGLLSSAK